MNESQPKEKTFDCLKYKREIQLEIYESIKGLSWEEQLEYYRKLTNDGPLADWWRSVLAANKARESSAGESRDA